MAEGDGGFRKSRNSKGDDSEDSDAEDATGLDLLEHPEHSLYSSAADASMAPRREENPFSFKHFLQSDKNYQNQGARPKVYCEGRPVAPPPASNEQPPHQQSRMEFSSALPDFVQDHLVIEQCYLGNSYGGGSGGVSNSPDSSNLPDFTINRSDNRPKISSSSGSMPFDLPARPQPEFPLDLPTTQECSSSRNHPPSSEVGNSKSLPDFLADGAVRTSQSNNETASNSSPEREADRLRQELDAMRRELVEQTRRAEYLSRELEIARSKEHEYTQNLAKALEQVEENLERSNIRAASSENTILKLRQEVKSLNGEISALRRENATLRGEEGASGGGAGPSYPTELQSQRLAQELRQAAGTAEHSLSFRQLLNGVENLRMLASSLENMNRFEETLEYSSDTEADTGPAL